MQHHRRRRRRRSDDGERNNAEYRRSQQTASSQTRAPTVPDVYQYGCENDGGCGSGDPVVYGAASLAMRAFVPPSYRSHDLEDKDVRRLEQFVRSTLADVERFYSNKRRQKERSHQKCDKGHESSAADALRPGCSSSATYLSTLTLYRRDGARADGHIISSIRDISAQLLESYRGNMAVGGDLHRDEDLEHAHHEFVACHSMIRACDRLRSGGFGGADDLRKAENVVLAFMNANGAPFAWTSSATFSNGPVPSVYFTYVPREHCVMLAWRAAMIAMRHAMRIFDPCNDFRSFYEYAAGEYDGRRALSVRLIVYALTMVENYVIAMLLEQSGSLEAQALTHCAVALPEMRMAVIGAFTKTARALLTSVVLNHLNYIAIRADKELAYEAVRHMSRNIAGTQEMTDSERQLCYNIVNATLGDENESTHFSMRCSAFSLCAEALSQLSRAVWRNTLDCTFPWFDDDDDYDEGMQAGYVDNGVSRESPQYAFFASSAHRAAWDWLRTCVGDNRASTITTSNKDERSPKLLNEHVRHAYRRGGPARALRALLLGTAVYHEVYMNMHTLTYIEEDDPSVLERAALLAHKVEILLAPAYGRSRAAFEFICWLLEDIKVRSQMCDSVTSFFNEDETAYENGLRKSVLHLAVADHDGGVDDSKQSARRRTAMRQRQMVTPFKSLVEFASDLFVKRDVIAHRPDENDDVDENVDAYVSTSSSLSFRRLIPLDKRDVEMWRSIFGKDVSDVSANDLHCFTMADSRCYLPGTIMQLCTRTRRNIAHDSSQAMQRNLARVTRSSPAFSALPNKQ